MKSLKPVYDFDPRLYKKDYGNRKDNDRDFIDWCDMHRIEYKFEGIIRRQYLHHYYGVQAYDLANALMRDYLLGRNSVNRIINHILYYNKHVEIDNLDQEDERLFLIYSRPRFKVNVQYPYSIFCYEYYDALNNKLKA